METNTHVSFNVLSPVLMAAGHAAGGAATGALGAKVLQSAGHAGYDVLTATQHGAIGGAILALPATVAIYVLTPPDRDTGKRNPNWGIVGAAALAAADGALGAAVLRSAGHTADLMAAGPSAAACATGAAILSGAIVALTGIYVLTGSCVMVAGSQPATRQQAFEMA